MSSATARLLAVLGMVVILVGACGDDDSGGTATTAVAGTSTTTAGSTTTGGSSLTLTVEGLAGFEGRVVVGSLSSAEGGNSGVQGTVCLQVDADPWTGSGVFSTADPSNPCAKGSPFGEVITQDGDYSLIVGVYTPGESTPAVCVNTTATISGPSAVIVAAADMVPNCTG